MNGETLPGRILVVDDNAMNRDLLTRYLQHAGHSVNGAEHGLDALEQLRQTEFDLVLLDIMMPKMDGYQVLEAMRADQQLCFTPVVVLSAVGNTASIVRCLELGAIDYITKPFELDLLRARVDSCLERKRMRDREQDSLRQLEREKKQVQDLLRVVIPVGVELTSEPDFAQLLEKILMGGKLLCNADGGTLYLRTSADTLEYVIVQNDTLRIGLSVADDKPELFAPISLTNAQGTPEDGDMVVGRVALSGATINLPLDDDLLSYTAPQVFDALADYRTLSLLTLPLMSSRGDVIGVLQYVNARDEVTGEHVPFSRSLQQLIEALAALAAAALEGYVREAGLKQTIEELRVKVRVDDSARNIQVSSVTETDFFVRLRAYIQDFRASGA